MQPVQASQARAAGAGFSASRVLKDKDAMISKIAVLCWEESRPWVSALRQNGYSAPWVEEPKGDSYKQIPRLEPNLVLIDLTRPPDQGKAMAVVLAGNDALSG